MNAEQTERNTKLNMAAAVIRTAARSQAENLSNAELDALVEAQERVNEAERTLQGVRAGRQSVIRKILGF